MEASKPASKARRALSRHLWLYLLLAPGLLYFLIFKIAPMWGVLIAFQDYSPFLGFFGSEWVGFTNFTDFFINPDFFRLFENTLILSALNLVIFFPLPIVVAILLNEIRLSWYKRWVQTLVYIPHFISMVIIASISYMLFNTQTGPINGVLYQLTGSKIEFLGDPAWFRPLILLQIIWKETGWSTIIYLAAIASVDIESYEAAIVDGASRFQQMMTITLPAMTGTIIIMFILRLGHVLDTGFEQIFLMTNALNRSVAEVFDTYVYTVGITQGSFSYSTAVGLFKSVIGLILIKAADSLAKKAGHSGIL